MWFNVILLLLGFGVGTITLVRLGSVPSGLERYYDVKPEYRRLWVCFGMIMLALWRMLG